MYISRAHANLDVLEKYWIRIITVTISIVVRYRDLKRYLLF